MPFDSPQICYAYGISRGAGDLHQLDADADGVACESLPSGFLVIRERMALRTRKENL